MSRPGGAAEKLGNRYEGLWTADVILDLIDGLHDRIIVEPIGEEADGIEFCLFTGTAREYHSVKRRETKGNWTTARLTTKNRQTGRSIVGDLFEKLTEYPTATAMFASGTSASELQEITDRARIASDGQNFVADLAGNQQLSGAFRKYILPIFSNDADDAHSALSRLKIQTEDESRLQRNLDRRLRTRFQAETSQQTVSAAARTIFSDLVLQRLGAPLTRGEFLSSLSKLGIHLNTWGKDQRTQLDRLRDAFLHEIDPLLINGKQIPRSATAEVLTALQTEKKWVVLEGPAGSGKSSVMGQLVSALRANDTPSIVLRLDGIDPFTHSSRALGEALGLPESPAMVLGSLAPDITTAIVIDQLDAISVVSGRNQALWTLVNELLDESEQFPNLKILLACRTFDLENDPRLRELSSDSERAIRIQIGQLTEEDVLTALRTSGVDDGALSSGQQQILSTPLHLYLYLSTALDLRPDFSSPGALYDAFWNDKRRRIDTLLAADSFSSSTTALSQILSERATLSAPLYLAEEQGRAFDLLASESVIVTTTSDFRFFHESFFDYAFARGFLSKGEDVISWLEADPQPLFRRSQIRQVLAFLRERDWNRYTETLRRFFQSEPIRFHLKRVILQWLGSLGAPTTQEWQIVEECSDDLAGHHWPLLSGSAEWFDVAFELGRPAIWLASGDDDVVDRVIGVISAPSIIERRGDRVAELLRPYLGREEAWDHRLRWLVARADCHRSEGLKQLFLDLIELGTLDHSIPRLAVNDDWWSLLYTASTADPEFTSQAIGAWLDRQATVAADEGKPHPFMPDASVPYSQLSEHVIEQAARGAPLAFAQMAFRRIERAAAANPNQRWILAAGMLGDPPEQIIEATGNALAELAVEDPDALDALVGDALQSPSRPVSALLLRAWSANGACYADQMISFLIGHPEERLTISYDVGGGDSFSMVAIYSATAHCSAESLQQLEAVLVGFTPEHEIGAATHRGRTELNLLRSIRADRRSPTVNRRVAELHRKFPQAPPEAPPELPQESITSGWVQSPIPTEAQAHMSDEQWLSAMHRYRSDTSGNGEDFLKGGAYQLAGDLERQTTNQPSRFAALVERMTLPECHHVYFSAILKGLTKSDADRAPAGDPEDIIRVMGHLSALDVDEVVRDVLQAFQSVAFADIPQDLITFLSSVAQDHRDPETDEWTSPNSADDARYRDAVSQAINSARGTAARSIAALLFARPDRYADLSKAVQSLCGDPVLAVRSTAAECLIPLLDGYPDDAFSLFDRLVDGAVAITDSPFVRRFLGYAMYRRYDRIRPIFVSMLESDSPSVVTSAAEFVTVATLRIDEALNDGALVSAAGGPAQAGAAKIYAELISQEDLSEMCADHLAVMMNDEHPNVRENAADCWRTSAPEVVLAQLPLLRAYLDSTAFPAGLTSLLRSFEITTRPLPDELCLLARQALEAWGVEATSIQYHAAGEAHTLAGLIVRLHEQTTSDSVRLETLDIIDEMVSTGIWGIDDELNTYDRSVSR